MQHFKGLENIITSFDSETTEGFLSGDFIELLSSEEINEAFELANSLNIAIQKKGFFFLKLLKAAVHKKNKPLIPPEEEKSKIESKHLAEKKVYEGDLFIAESGDLPFIKDDTASMEYPIFALKAKDTRTIKWDMETSKGVITTIIRPSAELGRATIFDKDIWIYLISKLIQAKKQGEKVERVVKFQSADFMRATNKSIGGRQFALLKDSLNRLAGTRIETNIKTGDMLEAKGFGLIDSWEIIDKGKNDIPLSVAVELPKWLFRSVENYEVLSISPDYFRLKKSMDRRIYEVARKFCGKQEKWSISLDKLLKRTGSITSLRKFRYAIKSLIIAQALPDYEMLYKEDNDMIEFKYKYYEESKKKKEDEEKKSERERIYVLERTVENLRNKLRR